MWLRSPLDRILAASGLGWFVGGVVLGGFDDPTGSAVIGVSSFAAIGALAVELMLRGRDRARESRRRRRGAGGEHG